MSVLMATEKVRVVLQVDEEIRAALRLAVERMRARTGNDAELGDVVAELVNECLPDVLEEVRTLRKPPESGGGKRGR